MNRTAIFALLATSFLTGALPLSVNAAGQAAIEGRLPGGLIISVDVDTSPTSPNVNVWRQSPKSPNEGQTYEKEPCSFSEVSSSGTYLPTLTCSKAARSPLAGTRYVGKQYKNGLCQRDEPQLIYTCVAGCEAGTKAPKRLTQGCWE